MASDEDEEGRQAARMAAGQFTLQQCAIIVASLWSIGDRNMQKRLLQLLHQQVAGLPLLPCICSGVHLITLVACRRTRAAFLCFVVLPDHGV